jgi:hypothetical protein
LKHERERYAREPGLRGDQQQDGEHEHEGRGRAAQGPEQMGEQGGVRGRHHV